MNNARSFRSILMVASCAGAALGCYMISLRVASERSALEAVENRIVMAQQDIRTLQTEIGTRGRLSQLERWNVRVLALSAPSADQFLDGSFALARLTRPPETIELEAPVVLAAAPAPDTNGSLIGSPAVSENGDIAPQNAGARLYQASLKVRLNDDLPRASEAPPAVAKAPPTRKAPEPAKATPTKTASAKAAPVQKHRAAGTVDKKSTEKNEVAVAKPVTRALRLAKADPLAPLPDSKHGKNHKDSVSTR